MRPLTIVLCMFLSQFSIAQNYKCLTTGSTKFFINGNGYLRAVRIDSVQSTGSDIVYYPFRCTRTTLCAHSLDSNGGSWLGKQVIRQTDGTFLFDNIWHDTVIIKTQASLGETWTFYNDTSDVYYQAQITAVDTMSIAGCSDSVKYLTIYAYKAGVLNTGDSVNNFQIILSKNNGFFQAFDLYTFPYHKPGYIGPNNPHFDLFYDIVAEYLPYCGGFGSYAASPRKANSTFRLISLYNPTKMEIYDFSPGDVFQRMYMRSADYYSRIEYIQDSIVAKTSSPYSVSYDLVQRHSVQVTTVTYPSYATTTTKSYSVTTTHSIVDTSHLLYFNKLPEEWHSYSSYYYFPSYKIVDICQSPAYTLENNHINYYTGSGDVETEFSGEVVFIPTYRQTHAIGYGEILSTSDHIHETQSEQCYYVLKNGISCGKKLSVEVDDIPTTNSFAIFPNPANEKVAVKSATYFDQIEITNLLGQTVLSSHNHKASNMLLDISTLTNGIYLISVDGSAPVKLVKQ